MEIHQWWPNLAKCAHLYSLIRTMAIVGRQIPVTCIGLSQIQNAAIDWKRFFKGERKVKVTKDPDDTSLADLGFPATTSVRQLALYGRKLRANPPKGLTVVFSTYQSISAVHEVQTAGAFGAFDLIVCDEAHRTTGAIFKDREESEFVRVHDAAFIRGAKRLYMTATPRIYGESAKKKAGDEFIELCSMDDESVYGHEFHHLTFQQADIQGG